MFEKCYIKCDLCFKSLTKIIFNNSTTAAVETTTLQMYFNLLLRSTIKQLEKHRSHHLFSGCITITNIHTVRGIVSPFNVKYIIRKYPIKWKRLAEVLHRILCYAMRWLRVKINFKGHFDAFVCWFGFLMIHIIKTFEF